MISILIALTASIVCLIYSYSVKNSILVCAVFVFAAYLSNRMFKPRPKHIEFTKEDYELDNVFPLEPLIYEDDKPIYVKKDITTKTGESYVTFRSKGRNNFPSRQRALLRRDVRLIYDNKPEIRLYSAMKIYRGNILLSVLSCKAVDLIAEIHTPDAVAAFSKDSMVKG